jgi:hypothetical protein
MNGVVTEVPEVHQRGHLSVEAPFVLDVNGLDLHDVDFGLQVAPDGRVWVCLNGMALLRFKPHRRREST